MTLTFAKIMTGFLLNVNLFLTGLIKDLQHLNNYIITTANMGIAKMQADGMCLSTFVLSI